MNTHYVFPLNEDNAFDTTYLHKMDKLLRLQYHTLEQQKSAFYQSYIRIKALPYDPKINNMPCYEYITSYGFVPTRLDGTMVFCNAELGQILMFNGDLGYTAYRAHRLFSTDHCGLAWNTIKQNDKDYVVFTTTRYTSTTFGVFPIYIRRSNGYKLDSRKAVLKVKHSLVPEFFEGPEPIAWTKYY